VRIMIRSDIDIENNDIDCILRVLIRSIMGLCSGSINWVCS